MQEKVCIVTLAFVLVAVLIPLVRYMQHVP